MDKTAVVTVERQFRHRMYKKMIKKTKRFIVHDEENKTNVGDIVEIMETRPLSKLKRWRLINIIEKSK
ncbi:MAG TPA: 30S ribosomal protein S17 [Actinobacteria bacterium]|nr:30S ribosomal protein S17 [Actinomycetes bacterium]HEX21754.1 30S ribosomal protein S17 [Actinomycetota bacterium]